MTYDYEAALRAVDHHVRLSSDRLASAAIARLADPESKTTMQLPPPASGAEAWGRIARSFNDALEAIAAAFAKGYLEQGQRR